MSSQDKLRRRSKASDEKSKSDAETDKEDDADALNEQLSAGSPQASDKTTEAIDSALKDFSPRWRNYIIRTIFTIVMILVFAFIIYLGPLAIVVLIQLIQIKCYHEIISIGYIAYKSHDLPWFRTLSWHFLLASNYYFYGESAISSFSVLLHKAEFLEPLITYHRFISFSLYTCGLVAFVLSLTRKKLYLKQFTLFAWTHIALLILVTQSHMIIQNIFEGLIWCLVPVSLIICNDIMAYIFGFFFGKTPLIKLSPKKTWEGFIGAAFSTIVFGWIISSFLVKYKFFVCPIAYSDEIGGFTLDCEPGPIFRLTEYTLPKVLHILGMKTVRLYPFVLHSLSLSIFASSIGPFGGFFASGFKRAFKIKDFGDTIPGHGGFMDRFDCQFFAATFVNVYISSFVRGVSPQKLLAQLFSLKPQEQLEVFAVLRDRLVQLGLLQQAAAQPLAGAGG